MEKRYYSLPPSRQFSNGTLFFALFADLIRKWFIDFCCNDVICWITYVMNEVIYSFDNKI